MANTHFYVPRLVKEGAWEDWRDRYAHGKTAYGDRPLANIRYAAAHHSVTHPTGNAKKDVDMLANIHINGNGWLGIGYHFVITSEVTPSGFAKVIYVGDIGTVRAHTYNAKGAAGLPAGTGNLYIVSAVMIGMNHQQNPSEAQLRSMRLLMEELVYFEDARIPKLLSWADVHPHKVFDWTQCNGFDHIMNMIKTVNIPAENNSKPVPASVKLPKRIKFLAKLAKTEVWDLTSNPNYKTAKTLKKGEEFVAYAKIDFNNTTYYVTEFSHGKGWKHGVNKADLIEAPVATPAPTPAPTPKPEPVEKPVVRALGMAKTVLVGAGDKVVDVITGEVTREYKEHEPFDATHEIEYKGKKYYMTQWAYQQYQKGKNPTGVDVDTVGYIVVPPKAPAEPELPPNEEREEIDPELIKQHDKDIADLKKRVDGLDGLIKMIMDFLSDIFKNFKKDK